jgi:acetyl esterase/lipase
MEPVLDMIYSEHDSEQRKMDVFLPDGNANGVGLFFIHGGGWRAGNRTSWHSVAEHFRALGYTCVSVGYRLVPNWTYPAPVEDVRLAMSFFLENAERFGFDPAKTAVLGSSAGGHLSAMLSTISADDDLGITSEVRIRATKPKAAILYCPATNLHLEQNFERLLPSLEGLIARTGAEAEELYREASPIDRIDGSEPTTLLIHGDADETIPVEHSIQYHEKLLRHGVASELVVLPGVPHGFGYGVKTEAQLASLKVIEAFLAKTFAK